MSKIYQKMYLQDKNRSKGVLGGFMDNVILRSCNSVGCLANNPRGNKKDVILRSCNSVGCLADNPHGNRKNVILRGCNSGSQLYSFVSEDLFAPFVIPEDYSRKSQPCKTTKWLRCRVKTPRHDSNRKDAIQRDNSVGCLADNPHDNRKNVILKSCDSVNCLANNPRGNKKDVILRGCNSGSQPYFAKRAGFTLIELLVVVLIIGILSAIAFPHYQLAVLKSRYTQAIVTANSLRRAQDVYYMANGTYATDMRVLDVQLSGCQVSEEGDSCQTEDYICRVYDGSVDAGGQPKGTAYCIFLKNSSLGYSVSPHYSHPICLAAENSKLENQLCINLGGKYFGTNNGYNDYYLK